LEPTRRPAQQRAPHADGEGLTENLHRATLELFQSEIAPVLRREIPSRPLGPRLGGAVGRWGLQHADLATPPNSPGSRR
jgi:hypothetical protein